MKIDYDVGDAVVCVGQAIVDYCNLTPIPIGTIHRAVILEENCFGEMLVGLEGKESEEYCYMADAFRKLPKADEEFTAYMRKMKPSKKSVTA